MWNGSNNSTQYECSFAIEHRQALSQLDVQQFLKASSYTTESVFDMKLPTKFVALAANPNVYNNYIKKSMESLGGPNDDITDEIVNFFIRVNNSPELEAKNLVVAVEDLSSIEKIRPQYLNELTANFSHNIASILKKSISMVDLKKKYGSSEYITKLKKYLVKTSIPNATDIHTIMAIKSKPIMVTVNREYIREAIIPFLKDWSREYKDMTTLAVNTMSAISETSEIINGELRALDLLVSNNKVDLETMQMLSYYIYNTVRIYMTCCAYLVSIEMRKISMMASNKISYINLYNTINNFFPGGATVLHENAIDGTIEDIDDITLVNSMLTNKISIVTPYINNVVERKKMLIMNSYRNDLMGYPCELGLDNVNDNYEYNTQVYENIVHIFDDVLRGLDIIKIRLKDGEVFDDIVDESDLGRSFSSKYDQIVLTIDNIDCYVNDLSNRTKTMLTVYADLSNFEDNIERISEKATQAYEVVNDMISDIEHDTFDSFSSTETSKEVLSFLEQFKSQYKEYTLVITRALLKRLKSLAIELHIEDETEVTESEVVMDLDENYTMECVSEYLDELNFIDKIIFESMITDHYVKKNKIERGVQIVFEDGDADNSNKTQSNTTNDSNKETTSVSVDKPAESENSNNNSSSTNNTKDGSKKNLIDRLRDFIDKIFGKVKDKVKDVVVKKNNPWLTKQKDKILALDLSKCVISILPYNNVDKNTIVNDISSSSTKIRNINADNLNSSDFDSPQSIQRLLFPQIPADGIGDTKDFSAVVTKYYMTGKEYKPKSVQKFEGDSVKSLVNDMISYCESYSTFVDSVTKSLSDLTDAVTSKIDDIVGNESTENRSTIQNGRNDSNISVTNNGNKQNGSSEKNSDITIASKLSNSCRMFTAAVLTAIEKRYFDYVKALNALAPKDGKKPDAKDTDKKNN